jgi:DNA-binding protein HU-beta
LEQQNNSGWFCRVLRIARRRSKGGPEFIGKEKKEYSWPQQACEVSNKVAKQAIETLAATAVAEVKKSGAFVVPGIGKLVRVDRKARMGRNPATGEAIKIPAKKVVKFRVAKAAKDAIVPPKKK